MKCLTPFTVRNPVQQSNDDVCNFSVPCGKCYPCLSNKSFSWQFRIEQEQKVSTSSYFVTLTYNDDHVPHGDGILSLNKYDLQCYLKRLRKANRNKLRYFAVGEYGGRFNRPHYHIILFNAVKKTIDSAWNTPRQVRGLVDIGDVTPASIRYVSAYILTKVKYVNPEVCEVPFQIMSKGLGLNYINEKTMLYHRDNLIGHVTLNGGIKQPLPRYLKDKIFDRSHIIQMRLENDSFTPNEDSRVFIEKVRKNERLFKNYLISK